MAARSARERAEREARRRARLYVARKTVIEGQAARRHRDNIAAIIAVVIVGALTTVAQIGFFTYGPGAPAPKPSPSASASPSASVTPSTSATPSSSATSTATPSPSASTG